MKSTHQKAGRAVLAVSAAIFALAAGFSPVSVPVAHADSPPPYPVFTSRFQKAPPAGQRGRITVQIRPGDTSPASEAATPAVPDPAPATGKARFGWFWDDVPPGLDAPGVNRLELAVNALSRVRDGGGVPGPRLQFMHEIAASYGTDILRTTVGTKVSPALVLAVIAVESAGKTDALSSKGATGLMQLMPDTAARFGVTDPSDAAENMRGGIAYLDWLMAEFDNDPVLVLAAYNAGEGAVRTAEGVPDYPETRDYVPKVLAAWTVARGMCLTPPELISDGCVFRN